MLELTLNEAVSWRRVGNDWRWIGVDILAINPTDRDGSLVSAELYLMYTWSQGAGTVTIPHDSTFAPHGGTAPLELPAHLRANGALRGWLSFKLPDEIARPEVIQRYDARVRDSRGLVATIQISVFKELRYDPEES